jgi:hypothetical protein
MNRRDAERSSEREFIRKPGNQERIFLIYSPLLHSVPAFLVSLSLSSPRRGVFAIPIISSPCPP